MTNSQAVKRVGNMGQRDGVEIRRLCYEGDGGWRDAPWPRNWRGSWPAIEEIVQTLEGAGWTDVRMISTPGPVPLTFVAGRKP